MYALSNKPMSFEDFLVWDDGSSQDCELQDGYPVPIVDPNAQHEDVVHGLCRTLEDHCKAFNLPYVPRQGKQVLLRNHPLTGRQESRKADIVVFTQEEWDRMRSSSSSAAAHVPPPLVIEVVSSNWKVDYDAKVGEYEETGISEYWIVDYAGFGGIRFIGKPKQPTITIYTLSDGEYIPQQFRGSDRLISQIFPHLQLTATEIFALS